MEDVWPSRTGECLVLFTSTESCKRNLEVYQAWVLASWSSLLVKMIVRIWRLICTDQKTQKACRNHPKWISAFLQILQENLCPNPDKPRSSHFFRMPRLSKLSLISRESFRGTPPALWALSPGEWTSKKLIWLSLPTLLPFLEFLKRLRLTGVFVEVV